jgi:class 3 adenylate cyclase
MKIIAISTDITIRKKAEKKLEEQNTELLVTTKRLETTNEILEHQSKELAREREKSEELLLNILPYTVAKQLKTKGYSNLRKYRMVTVMFTDFKGFTQLAEKIPTEQLIERLSFYFDKYDNIIDPHYIEKIKTIGDAYMCAGGLPLRNKSNPIDVTLASLAIQDFTNTVMEEQIEKNEIPWGLRLGIHTGEVIAGVIGTTKFAYDIWGDTVNTASRMESTGAVGKVNISEDTYAYIKDYFDCTYRGKVNVKHKGEMEMYFVDRLKPQFSEDKKGIFPNDAFKKILAGF